MVAYKVALPPLASVHNVFHVSTLRIYESDSSHVLSVEQFPIDPDLRYEEKPIRILDNKEKQLRNKVVRLVRVQWSNHT